MCLRLGGEDALRTTSESCQCGRRYQLWLGQWNGALLGLRVQNARPVALALQ